MKSRLSLHVVCFVACLGALLVAACDNNGSSQNNAANLGFRPSTSTVLQMTTTAGPLGVSTATCQAGMLFTPSVTIVITGASSNASIDTVTFHLIDGSAAGGPSITFPRLQLTELFGSTVVVGSRGFPFTPTFVCPSATLRAIDAEVALDDGRQLTASLALH